MFPVAHICHPFLPRSETFVYERVKRIGSPSLVLSDEPRQHADLFPHDQVFNLSNLSYLGKRANQLAAKIGKPYPAYLNWLKQQQAKVILAHHGPVGAFVTPLAKAAGLPLAVCFYGIDASAFLKDPKWIAAYQPMFQQASLVVALSQDMMARLEQAGCPKEKLFENHLARDSSQFVVPERKPHGGAIRLLAIGRLVPKKGFDDVIEVLGELKKRGEKFQFTLVGEGPEIVKLEKRWLDLGMAKDVNWVGALDSEGVRRWMAWADVVLAPSKRGPDGDEEGTPTVIVEAGLMGCAIVSTFHAGIPGMIQNDSEAVLIQEGDREALFSSILDLQKSPERVVSLGLAARKRMVSDYDAATEAKKLEERLERL